MTLKQLLSNIEWAIKHGVSEDSDITAELVVGTHYIHLPIVDVAIRHEKDYSLPIEERKRFAVLVMQR